MQEIMHVSGKTLTTPSELEAFTDGWLGNRRLSEHTRDAYRRDVRAWIKWCVDAELDPLAATFVHVNRYAREIEDSGLAPASVGRRLSGISSWYTFLVKIDALPHNPVSGADGAYQSRDHSATVGLTADEVDQVLAAASNHPRDHAVLTLLADLGMRVSEVLSLDLTSTTTEAGRPVIRYLGKGGKWRKRSLTPGAVVAIARWLLLRPVGESPALFTTRYGGRLDRHRVFVLVRVYAGQAGLPSANQVSPHSLRHAFATTARDLGVALEDVQDAMGHADPRTTRRYDRDRHNLDRDPSLVLGAARAKRQSDTPPAM